MFLHQFFFFSWSQKKDVFTPEDLVNIPSNSEGKKVYGLILLKNKFSIWLNLEVFLWSASSQEKFWCWNLILYHYMCSDLQKELNQCMHERKDNQNHELFWLAFHFLLILLCIRIYGVKLNTIKIAIERFQFTSILVQAKPFITTYNFKV